MATLPAYVACTRARDLLILPYIPQAAKDSWFSSINLRQTEIPELDLSAFPEPSARPASRDKNEQPADVFAAERRRIEMAETALRVLALRKSPRSGLTSFPNWQYGQRGTPISPPDALMPLR